MIVIPDTTNSNSVYPKIEVTILSDGSLKLEIIDDVNTTAYNPSDRFTVSYSSSVQGIDFKEFFQFSESGSSDWGGYLDAESGVGARLEISPNDANGTSFVELPLTTSYTGPNPFEFKARAYDQNGLELDTSGVEWNISLSFQPPEGNQSLVADLGNSIGSSTNMVITSTLAGPGSSTSKFEAREMDIRTEKKYKLVEPEMALREILPSIRMEILPEFRLRILELDTRTTNRFQSLVPPAIVD